jgi:amidase
VRDTIAFWDGVSKAAPRSLPSMIPTVKAPAAALRIGFYTATPKGTPVEPEYVQAVKDVAKKLESLGHAVFEIPNPIDAQFADDFTAYWGFVAYSQSRTMAALAQKGFEKAHLDPWTEGLAQYFWKARLKGLASTWRLRNYHRKFFPLFERYDVLLSPVLAHTPPTLGHLAPSVEWNEQLERLTAWVPFTQVYNVTGAPAISLPLARTSAGMPIGLQFGTRRGDERVLLELALQLEEAMPWPKIAPAPAAVK